MTQIPAGGELVHVGIDVDDERLATLAHRPMHGVALVEAGAEHDEAVEVAAEHGAGCVAGAGVAEHTKRQLVVLRKHAFRTERRRHRDRPALRDLLEARRGGVVLDPGSGKDRDVSVLAFSDERQRFACRRGAQRRAA
jgi:hypothetical protein